MDAQSPSYHLRGKQDRLTKSLALIGPVLVWLPLLGGASYPVAAVVDHRGVASGAIEPNGWLSG